MSRRTLLVLIGAAALAAVGLYFQPSPLTLVAGCIRSRAWPPALLWLTNSADLRIFVAYLWISVELVRLRPRLGIPLDWIFSAFAAFILSCGVTHLLKAVTSYWPVYWLAYDVDEFTADVSLATAAALTWVVAPKLEAAVAEYRGRISAERRDKEAAEETADELRRALQKLAEFSAPVLKLPNDTIALVVVGEVAAERAQNLMEAACEAIREHKAKYLIIDVSGVPTMDTAAVSVLGQVAGAAVTMGSRVTVSGIKPVIAMAMARAGVRFEDGAGTALDAETAMLGFQKRR